MTFKNARYRFEAMGYEVIRADAPYKYKFRRIGGLKWTCGSCLDALLRVASGDV